jgi:vacuolar-type H+-ATPase subunit E/Vma4
LEQVRGRLSGIRTDAVYPEVMGRLLRESLGELEGSESEVKKGESYENAQPLMTARLELDPRDRALVEGLLGEIGVDLSIGSHLECWGGMILQSEDGCIVVINTLEARLERAIPHLRQRLAALFENDQPEAILNQPLEWDVAVKAK